MAKIKIISNPYNREIAYQSLKEPSSEWEDIKISNIDSKLREDGTGKSTFIKKNFYRADF